MEATNPSLSDDARRRFFAGAFCAMPKPNYETAMVLLDPAQSADFHLRLVVFPRAPAASDGALQQEHDDGLISRHLCRSKLADSSRGVREFSLLRCSLSHSSGWMMRCHPTI
jgi:hypothetical protein